MGLRTAPWLGWSMCALSLALTALSLLLLVQTTSHPDVRIYEYWVIATLVAVGFSPVGAVIAPRTSPKNPIGWLFGVTGLCFGVIHFAAEYAIYALLAAPDPSLLVKPQHGSSLWLGSQLSALLCS